MKKFKCMEKGHLIKRISLAILIIVVFQIFIPVISNINFVPFVYAESNVYINGIRYGKIGNSSVSAYIEDENITEVKIEEKVNMGNFNEDVGWYIIKVGGYQGSEFKKLPKLRKLTIPVKLLKKMYDYCFEGADSIEELEITGDGELYTDGMVDFKKLKNLKKIVLSGYIYKIGDNVFKDMTSLEIVEARYCLKEIGYRAFYNCKKLSYFALFSTKEHKENFLEQIGPYAFAECTELSYTPNLFGEYLKKIGDGAFKGCSKFREELTKKSPVSEIGRDAFRGTAIYSVNIGGTLDSIKPYTFAECPNLHFITLSNKIKSIGEGAFYKCNTNGNPGRLLNNPIVEIPKSVTSIGKKAFSECKEFNIRIPSSVINIDQNGFSNITDGTICCSSESYAETYLKKNNIPYKLLDDLDKYSDRNFEYKLTSSNGNHTATVAKYTGTKTGKIEFPTKITVEGIEYTVREIGGAAFSNKSNCEVHIPSSVWKIRANAFENCTNLKVYIPTSVELIEDYKANAPMIGQVELKAFNSKDVEIHGYKGSEAEKYANNNKNNIKFVYSDNGSVGNSVQNNNINKNSSNNKNENVVSEKEKKSNTKNEQPKQEQLSDSNIWGTTASLIGTATANALAELSKMYNDTTAPEITWTKVYDSKDLVKIKFIIKDQGSGIRYYKLTNSSNESSGNYIDLGSGKTSHETTWNIYQNGKYYFYAKDVNGNTSKREITINTIDNVVPEIKWENVYNGNDMVKIKFTLKDSGLGVRYYKLTDNSNESVGEYKDLGSGKSSVSTTYTFYANKTHYLYVKDVNNNMSSLKVEINGIDSQAPKINRFYLKSYDGIGKKVTLEWEASDDGVGIKYWKVSNKKDDWNGNYISYNTCYSNKKDSKVISSNGTYYLYIKDEKGNAVCQSFNVNSIDENAPTLSTFSYRYVKNAVYVDWSAFDNGTGIKGWKISTKANDWDGNYNTYNTPKANTTGVYEIKNPSSYYLYIVDDNNRKVCKPFTITSGMIDKNIPNITKYDIVKEDTKTYIEFTAKDNEEGDRGLAWYCISQDENKLGTQYLKYSDSESKKEVTKKIQVKTSGTYYIFVKDKVGFEKRIGPINVDVLKPYISKYTFIYPNGGKYINKTHYLRKESKFNISIVCNEDIKSVDKSKIKINGIKANVDVKSINGKLNEFNIIIDPGTSTGEGTLSVEEGFLTDNSGNKSIASKKLNSVKIVVDGSAPKVEATYNYNKVQATIKDSSRIAKYQWMILNDNNKVIWRGNVNGESNPINKQEITRTLTLNKYIGRIIALYVQDIFGNEKTYTINPETKANVEQVSRDGNIVTYRITMNLKSNLYRILANNLQTYQTAKNFKVLDLKAEDDSGKKFLLRIDTNGKNIAEKIIIPKGTIFVYNQNDSREIEIEFEADNKKPTVSFDDIPTSKQKTVNLSFNISDANSGIKKYQLDRLDENGNVKKVLRIKKLNTINIETITNDYKDSITLVANGKVRLTVWDNQGNVAEKYIDIQNIDRVIPKVTVEYGEPDKNDNVEVKITADENISVKDNRRWTTIDGKTVKAKYKEQEITGTGIKDTVILQDEAGNEKTVNIKDKVAPRAIEITKIKANTGGTNVEIKLNEEIRKSKSLTTAGWNLSEDRLYLNKTLTENETIVVTDLFGNETLIDINVEDENDQGEKLYKGKKYTPSKSTTPATQVIKEIYLNRSIQSVDLMNLEGKVECELLDNNKTVKLTFNHNVETTEKIKLIVNESYFERIAISSVTNVVIKGDSNNDGTINDDDRKFMYNYIWRNQTTDDEYKIFAMDMNDDGIVNEDDYLLLKKIL